MKKSNIVVLALAAAASVVLIVLWFVLGFNHVDSPVDPIVTIVWFVLIAAVVAFVRSAEKRRCAAMRTCLVGDGVLFNHESGVVSLEEGLSTVDAIGSVLSKLEYGFDKVELPEDVRSAIVAVVRTHEYAEDGEVWSGEIAFAGRPDLEPLKFDSKTELAWALLGGRKTQIGLEPQEELPHDTSWRTI
jgi:hypothetical protein